MRTVPLRTRELPERDGGQRAAATAGGEHDSLQMRLPRDADRPSSQGVPTCFNQRSMSATFFPRFASTL